MRSQLLASYLCFIITGICIGEDLRQSQREEIARILQAAMEEQGIPGLSCTVATNDILTLELAFGLANVENNLPVSIQSKFRTASIAKPMTAAVIMSLHEAGLVDLDASVHDYCAAYPEKRWPITSRQLLGHLGGVRHYKSFEETLSTKHYFDLPSTLETFAHDSLLHQPGTKFKYTTFGYNLLGLIAEQAGDQEFMEMVRERVLVPANMQQTIVDDHYQIISGRVQGYLRPTTAMIAQMGASGHWSEGELLNAPMHDTSMKVPGGGILSTSSDLVRFATAMRTGQIVSTETRDTMWTRQETTSGEKTKYGLGWKIERPPGQYFSEELVGHTGGQAGTSTVLMLDPNSGDAVAIMCNLQRASLSALATRVLSIVQAPKSGGAGFETTDQSEIALDFSMAIESLQNAIEYEVESKDLPAFSISLVNETREVWSAGFGYQDAERTQPATNHTVYRVGSVSKLFTDIAIMQLREQGKLDLDKDVREYLPDFRPRNPFQIPITLRQLMTHRSGLVRESPVGNYFDPTEPGLAATVASLNDTGLVYQPDFKTKYSNAAVSVVGAVLEKLVAGSHPASVQATVLRPLGMKNTSFSNAPEIAAHSATGWMRTYDGRRFEAPEFLLGTGPAGNMYSSVSDLSKFLIWLLASTGDPESQKSKILESQSLRTMLQPVVSQDGTPQSFGIGFRIQNLDGFQKVGHGGAIYGFSTQLEAIPERGIGVAAVASLDGSNGVVRRLADYALRLMLAVQDGKELPKYQRSAPLPSSRARRLVGIYQSQDGQQITFSYLDEQLTVRLGTFQHQVRSLVDSGELVLDDPVTFGKRIRVLSASDIQIDDTVYSRLPLTPPERCRAEWKGLIGEYGWDHNTLYILEEAGQLYALIEWFYYYPLHPLENDEFAFPDYGLYHGEKLKFNRDEHGIASEVTAAEVRFLRRAVGTRDGETFRIAPVKPIDVLRETALQASPPPENGKFLPSNLTDLQPLDGTIALDIRYATTNNFMGEVFYQSARAFMQKPAAEAVVRANQKLQPHGLGILIHDAYRPWHVTKMFWDATPNNLKDFVANPANGSRHNRGCAVDLSLYDLASGQPIQMVAGYDEFSNRSFPAYPGGTARQRWYRELLRQIMESEGFTVYQYEWWHFDYQNWNQYRISNQTFEQISASGKK